MNRLIRIGLVRLNHSLRSLLNRLLLSVQRGLQDHWLITEWVLVTGVLGILSDLPVLLGIMWGFQLKRLTLLLGHFIILNLYFYLLSR